MRMQAFVFAGLALAFCSSCAVFKGNSSDSTGSASNKLRSASSTEQVSIPAPVVVYKTKKDYRQNVPVTLSADKSRITAYPAPADLKSGNRGYNYPNRLKDGYLLDNRGIGPNTAFLRLSYEEYAALAAAPSLEELKSQILDADPMLEIYYCPKLSRTGELKAALNRAIRNGELASLCTAEDAE